MFGLGKKMSGGLYFGPAGWNPLAWQAAPTAATPEAGTSPIPLLDLPDDLPGSLDFLRRAGIDQTSPSMPPLAAQLAQLGPHRARTLVVNMLPRQPESALPHLLANTALDDLVAGIEALRKLAPARRIVVVVNRHDWKALRKWKHALAGKRRLRVATLVNKYPLADPTILLRRLLGLKLPVGELPPKVATLMVDPICVWALGLHLRTGRPLTHRPVEIFAQAHKGEDPGGPWVVLAKIGTPLAELLRGLKIPMDHRQCIVNGMLAGTQVDVNRDLVESQTESIAIRDLPAPEHPSACISCGWCVDHCPADLMPVRLYDLSLTAAGSKSQEAREALHCIGCGLCSYVCPTRLPLMPQILALRAAKRAEPRHAKTKGTP